MVDEDMTILEWSPDERFIKCATSASLGLRCWKAYDLEDGCEVTWQSIPLETLEPKTQLELLQELQQCERFAHSNILKTKAHWVTPGQECVCISEYLCGDSLRAYLKKIQHPRRKLIKYWARQVLEGLNYLHAQSTAHQHVKLDNILIDPSTGTLKISGFGLSKFLPSVSPADGLSNRYLAQEAYQNYFGPSADIHAFGLLLLEICTLKKVYSECKTQAAIAKKIVNGELPIALKAVQDSDILDLVQLCLQPLGARPIASQLLQHAFFTQEAKDADRQPVPLDLKYIKQTTITISMKIKKEQDCHCISFNYNFNHDTPECATHKIINTLGLSQSNFSTISAEILKVLSSAVS